MTGPDPHPCDVPCRHCGATLARSGPAEMRAGDALFRHVVTLYCRGCGARTVWRPLSGDGGRRQRLPPRDGPN